MPAPIPVPVLAQLTGPTADSVPALPPAPFYDAWLFESPLPLAIVLLVVGLGGGFVLLQAGKRRGALVAGVLGPLLAVGAFAAGAAVETPRETLAASTADLVNATASADGAAMRSLLHPDVSLRPGSARFIPEITGRDRLIDEADRLPRAVDRVMVLETRAGLDGPRVGRTQVRLRVFGPGDQLYGHSWWGLDWQRHDGEWTAVGIEPLWIQGPN